MVGTTPYDLAWRDKAPAPKVTLSASGYRSQRVVLVEKDRALAGREVVLRKLQPDEGETKIEGPAWGEILVCRGPAGGDRARVGARGRREEDESSREQGEIALGAQRYADAAGFMEGAYAFDPNPQWLANAGFAWMMAGEQDRAIASYERALADKRLVKASLTKTQERLELARSARTRRADADAKRLRSDFAGAARVYDEVYAAVACGRYLLEAASAWEKSGGLDDAAERYRGGCDAPGPHARRTARGGRRARADRPCPQAGQDAGSTRCARSRAGRGRRGPPVLGWTLIGVGVVGVGVGIVGFVVANDERSSGVERAGELSQEQADAINDRAEGWWNVGLVAGGVGLAAAIVGTVLVVTHDGGPETRGSVEVEGHVLRGGGFVSAALRF